MLDSWDNRTKRMASAWSYYQLKFKTKFSIAGIEIFLDKNIMKLQKHVLSSSRIVSFWKTMIFFYFYPVVIRLRTIMSSAELL